MFKLKKSIAMIMVLIIIATSALGISAFEVEEMDNVIVDNFVHDLSTIELTPHFRDRNQETIIVSIERLLSSMIVESQMAEALADDARMTGFNFNGRLELGTRLRAYRYEYVLEEINDIHWYPILEDGRIVAIASIHGSPKEPIITMRVEFALELQSFLDNGNYAFALKFKGENLYVVTYSDKAVLWTYYGHITVNSPHILSSRGNAEMQLSVIETIEVLIPFTAVQPFTQQTNILPVPPVMQGTANLCWAACVVAVGRTHGGVHHAPSSVAAFMNIPIHQGATAQETRDALHWIYGISRSVLTPGVTASNVTMSINLGRPIIGGFMPLTGNMGHMAVIRGYETGPGWHHISFMDPLSGFTFTSIPPGTNPVISIVSGGRVMISNLSIR